jgi:hypothetical protein
MEKRLKHTLELRVTRSVVEALNVALNIRHLRPVMNQISEPSKAAGGSASEKRIALKVESSVALLKMPSPCQARHVTYFLYFSLMSKQFH